MNITDADRLSAHIAAAVTKVALDVAKPTIRPLSEFSPHLDDLQDAIREALLEVSPPSPGERECCQRARGFYVQEYKKLVDAVIALGGNPMGAWVRLSSLCSCGQVVEFNALVLKLPQELREVVRY